ncbi:YbaB/EbfC family nucleoid-associated protein [Kutzneria albida]|uniref:YbaB/EbfC DNA-binding family protein n=1 Tax=Kutzneria albida DSM 43870 TaxID=1449976 RepID=W5WM06_9PSEU|nr:YbaB/EbfC family nucleoid-associated protein [Kutzneria albida]AHI01587.1 hypothetical protein KALB_8229 [Kutzneria albida DSM 43870]
MNQDTGARITAFQESVKRAEKDVERYSVMQEEIVAIEVVENSREGAVTVVAGPSGAVRSITITPAGMRLSPQALSQSVTRTVQQGMAAAARKQAEIVQRYVGDRTDILDKVTKLQEELANPPAPQEDSWTARAEPPVRRPQAPAPQAPQARRPAPAEEEPAGSFMVTGRQPGPAQPAAPARREDEDAVYRFGAEEY